MSRLADGRNVGDLIAALTVNDGEFSPTVNAFVSVYPLNETQVGVELEYADQDNDFEIIRVDRFTLTVE